MRKTCKNCQFWERIYNNHYGRCFSKRYNDLSKFKYIADDELAYIGRHGEKYRLFFGEYFGCIHFKKKEI